MIPLVIGDDIFTKFVWFSDTLTHINDQTDSLYYVE